MVCKEGTKTQSRFRPPVSGTDPKHVLQLYMELGYDPLDLGRANSTPICAQWLLASSMRGLIDPRQ